MTRNQQRIFAAAIAAAIWGGGSAAQAQTIVNLTNLDPTASGFGASTATSPVASTSLDLLNTTTALSNGGLFPGAVSSQSQTAYNQLNTIGINANGSVSPVILGNQTPVAGTPNMVEINTITSAYNAVGAGSSKLSGSSSSTINNINAAISSAVNPIIGAAAGVNNPWTGGYGGAASGAALTANQVGVNTINGVGAAFADGTNVALSQLPGAAQPISGGTVAITNPGGGAASPPGTLIIDGITYTVSGGAASLAAGATSTYTLTPTSGQTYGSTGTRPGVVDPASTGGFTVAAPSFTPSATVIQGGSLNMSTTNTLLAYSPAGTVGINGNNGLDSKGAPVRGNQTAVNTFNATTLVGSNLSVGSQQLADGLNQYQTNLASVNRALAYSPGSQVANIDPSVTNLNQTASVGLNALNLQSGNGPTTATLSGIQSTGYNTTSGTGSNAILTGTGSVGSVPIAVVTNQVVASTVGAGGFMPTSTNAATAAADWAGLASTTAAGMPIPGSAGYPLVTTGQNASAFLGGSFNPNVATNPTNPYATLNAGTVKVDGVSQAVNLTNNTVSAGTAASPVNVAFGPAGFEQRTGTVGIASNTAGAEPALAAGLGAGAGSIGGLSNAQALTGVGSSSINALAQSFQTANNTFQGSGNVDGSLTQATAGIKFNAAQIESGSTTPGITAVNGGSGMVGPSAANNVGYVLDTAGTASALNNAVAGAVYGPVSLSSVAQSGTSFANVAAATGTIDTAASGTLAQNLGAITNYTGVQNAAVASSLASGNVSATGTTQSLNMTGNAVQAAAVNGSVAQLAAGSGATGAIPYNGTGNNPYGATNAVLASSGNGTTSGQGSASLSGTSQTNTTNLNAIQAAGALGSTAVPAAFSQQSGTAGNTLGNRAFSTGSSSINTAFVAPSNLAVVQATDGAGGSATANNTVQQAGLSVNAITGGTAGGLGITGMATQVSYGQSTSIGNQALAYAGNAPRGDTSLTGSFTTGGGGTNVAANAAVGSTMLGAQGVMSGNAALTNQQQLATQSLNTMSLAGANNGNLNQATFGATNQTSGNQLYAQSNGGYALTTGAQTATNAVNVITAR